MYPQWIPVLALALRAASGTEAELAREVKLETVLRVALARSPEIFEAHERALASRERAAAAAHLPDLELGYEQWAVPLGRPYALDDAGTLMLGLRQSFPAPGSRAARARAAQEDTDIALDRRRTREQDLATKVRRSFFEYASAEAEYALHLEQVELAKRSVELARTDYQSGRGSQQDVLRLIVEVSRLHNELAGIDQRRRSGRAMLNTLMARAPDAPLGPPALLQPSEAEARLAELESKLEERRPELSAALHALRRSEAELEAVRREARWPSFMAEVDYWLEPQAESRHFYAAMVSVNLPWLNGRHRKELRSAEHALAAERLALDAARRTALFQLHDAALRLEAARQSFGILDADLVPQARRSFEAAQAGYAAGAGDALALLEAMRSLLQARVEHSRAAYRVESALAELERAAGTAIPETKGTQP